MNIVVRVLCLVALCAPAYAAREKRISDEGRFLYANDDDWDWASPKGSPTPSRMSIYGTMGWSALDWMDEGIEKPVVLFVGTMPGGCLTEKELCDMRTNWRSFERVDHAPGIIAKRLADSPDICILMRDQCNKPENLGFTDDDLEALAAFVERGGRLLVLDDWNIYRPVLEKFLNRQSSPKKPETTTDADVRQRFDDLVRQLEDDNWSVRDRATTDLVALGRRILPLIDGVKSDDPEVVARLATVRAKFLSPKITESNTLGVPNDEMDRLLPVAKGVHPTSEIMPILRDAQKTTGRALRFRLAVENESDVPPPNGSGNR